MAMTLLCLLKRYPHRVYQICLVVSLCKKGLLLADRFLYSLACVRAPCAAAEAAGARWPGLHGVVCLPLPAVQGVITPQRAACMVKLSSPFGQARHALQTTK